MPKQNKSLTIQKVRRTRKHVVIQYLNGDEQHHLKSRDNPLPAFDKSIAALGPLVCELLALPSTYTENMKATGLTISDGTGNEMVTVVAQKSLADANGPFNIATPLRLMDQPVEEGSYSPPLSDAQVALVDEVVEQAKAYVLGERAQGQITFEEDKAVDADEVDEGEAPLPFVEPVAEPKPKKKRGAAAR